jgi:hypothetical protein
MRLEIKNSGGLFINTITEIGLYETQRIRFSKTPIFGRRG